MRFEPLFDVAASVADVAADAVAGGSSMVVAPLVDRGDGHAKVGGEVGDAEECRVAVLAVALELVLAVMFLVVRFGGSAQERGGGAAAGPAQSFGEGVERGPFGTRDTDREHAATAVSS